MKEIFFSFMACILYLSVYAQEISVPEPEFLHGYIHVTSPNTFTQIPRESATLKKHIPKHSKFAKIGEKATGATSSYDTFYRDGNPSVQPYKTETVFRTNKETITIDSLYAIQDMDIVLGGSVSSYIVPEKRDFNIIYKDDDNENDTNKIMRIVKFKKDNKKRVISTMDISNSLLDSNNETGCGCLPFETHKYGMQSYLIQIPGDVLEKGEYGIIFINKSLTVSLSSDFKVVPVGTTLDIKEAAFPIATFSVQ